MIVYHNLLYLVLAAHISRCWDVVNSENFVVSFRQGGYSPNQPVLVWEVFPLERDAGLLSDLP